MHSLKKGKNGELEFAKLCTFNGYPARRSQQYCGDAGDADVIGLPFCHVEVKRVEPKNFNIAKFMQQAIDDAAEGLIPIVAHRFNNCEWLITMREFDFAVMLNEYLKSKDEPPMIKLVEKARFNIYDELIDTECIYYVKGYRQLVTLGFELFIDIYREWEAGRGDHE
jgi:hypothetical protein